MRTLTDLLLSLSLVSTAAAAEPLAFRDLFNGKDLSGWIDVNTSPETWSVRDGMIVCTGKPIGVNVLKADGRVMQR